MRISLPHLCTAALIALAAPLAAQDADTPAAEDQTQAETTAPAAATPEFQMGQEVGAAATEIQPGQFYIREEFTDWALRCIYVPDQPDPCELYQLLTNAEGNPVAEFTVFPLPPGSGQAVAGATVVAPLETLLTEGVVLSIDSAPAREYQFSYCNRAGCVARIGLSQADLDGFRRGNAANLRIVPAADPETPFNLRISLAGFTAGMNTSTAYDPEAADEGVPGAAPAQ